MPSVVRGLLAVPAFLSVLAVAAAQPQYVRAHRTVSTDSRDAQAAFDDGLTLLYAFNPQEARRSFQRAADADPGLAIAYWGIAMSYGVNVNTPYDAPSQRRGHDAIAKAESHLTHTTAVERALVAAAAERFARFGKNDADASAQAYRDAMARVAAGFPDDDDVVTLAAEAAMDANPWGYWSDDGKPQPHTLEVVHELEAVLKRDPGHIGANHLLIHAVENSPHPEEGLQAARRLAADAFEPGAEHLTHMPAHTFMRVGDYEEAAEANVHALDAFRAYFGAAHVSGHETYYGHDCLFAVDAFMMAGEHGNAERAAGRCQDAAGRYAGYVAVRFHRWSDLAGYAGETPFLRGMAAATSERSADALSAAQQLDATKQDTATIGAAVIRAKVYAQHGERDREIASLEKAVQQQDQLGYSEPPAWFYPVRESLGAALYRASRYAKAEATFRADLVKNPKNPRSLFGLAMTLLREGHSAEASAVRQSFLAAWRHADVDLDMALL